MKPILCFSCLTLAILFFACSNPTTLNEMGNTEEADSAIVTPTEVTPDTLIKISQDTIIPEKKVIKPRFKPTPKPAIQII